MNITQLYEEVDRANQPYIIGHANPDGDCIGATLALAQLFEKMGRHVTVLLIDVPDTYNYLPLDGYVTGEVPSNVDLIITLDSGDKDRFGHFNGLVDNAYKIINIDHHASNPLYGDVNYVVEDVSSTSELLYTMIDDMSLMDQSIAQCLFTGIVYDTGVFKHSNTTKKTHMIAGELMSYGIDFTEIINRVFFYKSIKSLKIQQIAIERIEALYQDQVVMTYITLEDMKQLKAYKKHTEGIVQLINEIDGVRCSVFIYEIKEGIFKVSFRAKDTIDVCEIARVFGGGGHIKASGCTIEGDIGAVKAAIVAEIEKQL